VRSRVFGLAEERIDSQIGGFAGVITRREADPLARGQQGPRHFAKTPAESNGRQGGAACQGETRIFYEDASKPDGDAEEPRGESAGGESKQQQPPPPVRYRLRFEKRGALQFISHHDLMRTFELALRRAGIDVAHTRGFNPRPKLSFAMALPLGVESMDEILDIDLATPLSPTTLLELLGKQMPSGIKLMDAWPAKGRPRVTACEFEVLLDLDATKLEELSKRLADFLAGGAVMHSRRKGPGKNIRVLDARAHTLTASLDASRLSVRIAFTPQGGMKATDLLEVLGLDALAHKIVKTRTIFEEVAAVESGGDEQAPSAERTEENG
jgi:radical SAM-linked protein